MSEEVVRVENVGLRIGATAILTDVNLVLPQPALVTLLGPNGAGKTTLLDLLAGLRKPSSGQVSLFGSRLGELPYPRERVGVVLQREFVPDHMTVGEYAELFAAIHGIRDGADAILRAAEIADRREIAVSRVSGGEASRLFLAAATAHAPPLILLDEPTAQLDPENKRRIGQVLRELARASTVVLSTHDLAEAERLSDWLVFVSEGRVAAAGPRAEITHGGTVEEAFFRICGARILASGERA